MPRVLVVFESWHGNTAAVARAVGEGVAERVAAEVVAVRDAPILLPDGVDLVVVGGPTHAVGVSRTATAQEATGPSSARIGVHDWLELLDARPGVRGAAFDTHVPSWVHGSAARGIRRCLRRAGVSVPTGVRGFLVHGVRGPLLDGELDRARRWGAELGSRVESTAGRT